MIRDRLRASPFRESIIPKVERVSSDLYPCPDQQRRCDRRIQAARQKYAHGLLRQGIKLSMNRIFEQIAKRRGCLAFIADLIFRLTPFVQAAEGRTKSRAALICFDAPCSFAARIDREYILDRRQRRRQTRKVAVAVQGLG